MPLLDTPQLGSLTAAAQLAFSGVFVAALEVCAPVLLALIITDAALGVVSRVVPQLNVFAVGFPAKIAIGLLLDRRLAAVRRRLDQRRAPALCRHRPRTLQVASRPERARFA